MTEDSAFWGNDEQALLELKRVLADAGKKRDKLRPQRTAFLASLYRARQQGGLSQSDLAKLAGTTQSVISRIENGRGNPGLNTLLAIAKALDASLMLE